MLTKQNLLKLELIRLIRFQEIFDSHTNPRRELELLIAINRKIRVYTLRHNTELTIVEIADMCDVSRECVRKYLAWVSERMNDQISEQTLLELPITLRKAA